MHTFFHQPASPLKQVIILVLVKIYFASRIRQQVCLENDVHLPVFHGTMVHIFQKCLTAFLLLFSPSKFSDPRVNMRIL